MIIHDGPLFQSHRMFYYNSQGKAHHAARLLRDHGFIPYVYKQGDQYAVEVTVISDPSEPGTYIDCRRLAND